MQKIVIVKYLLQEKGGIEKRTRNYISEFLLRDFEVTVLYASERKNYRRQQGVVYKKVTIGPVPSRNLRKIVFAHKTTSLLKKQPFQQHIKLSMGRTGGAEIVIAAGNYPGTTIKQVRQSTWYRNRLFYLDKISFASSELILAASLLVKGELQNLFGLPAEKIKVLNPPVKSSDYYPLPEEQVSRLREEHKLEKDQLVFLFMSTGHRRKGLSLLLKIFSRLDPEKYRLLVAGDSFHTQVPNVTSLGFRRDTSHLYNLADCVLHPASYEAFGQVVTESLLCGTPVMISDRVGAKEILDKDLGEILPFGDADTWTEKIKDFSKDRYRIRTQEIRARLDIKTHIDEMLKLYALQKNK